MSEPDTERAAGPLTPQTPAVSNYGMVLTVYILYLVGFLTGITVFVGLIIAYLQRDRTDRVSRNNISDYSGLCDFDFCCSASCASNSFAR